MRKSPCIHAEPSLTEAPVSLSDSLALAFGLISTLLAILTVVVTRVNHPARGLSCLSNCKTPVLILPVEREPQYLEPVVAHPQDMVVEEMRLRRWSSMRRNGTNRLRLEE